MVHVSRHKLPGDWSLGFRINKWTALRYFTEICSGFEAGSYLRLIDFVYHSTLGLRVIKKKKKLPSDSADPHKIAGQTSPSIHPPIGNSDAPRDFLP